MTDKRSSGSAAVIINVQNVNDACPVVKPASQTVQITDPVQPNSIVAVVRVKDIDSMNLTYAVSGGSDLFSVDKHGSIRTVSEIDINTAVSYQLTVSASDGVCTRNASVTITVNSLAPCPDCNDFKFGSTRYSTSVQENVNQGGPILTIGTVSQVTTTYELADKSVAAFIRVHNETGT